MIIILRNENIKSCHQKKIIFQNTNFHTKEIVEKNLISLKLTILEKLEIQFKNLKILELEIAKFIKN